MNFSADLARRVIASYCHTNAFGVRCAPCVIRQKLKTNRSNIVFYKTTGRTVLNIHMKHDLTPGSQNCKTESGRIIKMAAVTENNKKKTLSTTSTEPLGIFGLSLA